MLFTDLDDIFYRSASTSPDLQEKLSAGLSNLATLVGYTFLTFYLVKFTWSAIKGLRLYCFSRIGAPADFVNRYGKWAVISGSTDGIGLAMAAELARRGHSIVVIGRNQEKLEKTKIYLEKEPNVGEVLTVKIDLSDSSLENFDWIQDQIDPDHRDIGILINNAGIMSDKFMRLHKFDTKYLQSSVNINVLAPIYLTRMILPGMISRNKGLVINTSSILGTIPANYYGVYGPTKSFINTFSKQLQNEYRNYPIDFINLTPGGVQTKLFTSTGLAQPEPTIVTPSPENFAKSTLDAASTRISTYCGCPWHEVYLYILKIFVSLGIDNYIWENYLKSTGTDDLITPERPRKSRPSRNQIDTKEQTTQQLDRVVTIN